MKKIIVLWLVGCLACPEGWSTASACSRATWIGRDGSVITGRTMDWPYDFNTHFYVIPRGEKNEGLPGGYSWTSKYGTVVAAGAANPGGPISGVFDGMNEQGLGGNMLYLAETDFGPEPSGAKARISWTAWLQYVLSNFGTVKEAVEGMKAEPVYLVPVSFGPGVSMISQPSRQCWPRAVGPFKVLHLERSNRPNLPVPKVTHAMPSASTSTPRAL